MSDDDFIGTNKIIYINDKYTIPFEYKKQIYKQRCCQVLKYVAIVLCFVFAVLTPIAEIIGGIKYFHSQCENNPIKMSIGVWLLITGISSLIFFFLCLMTISKYTKSIKPICRFIIIAIIIMMSAFLIFWSGLGFVASMNITKGSCGDSYSDLILMCSVLGRAVSTPISIIGIIHIVYVKKITRIGETSYLINV